MISTIDQERKSRLIVLVPDCLAGNVELAHKIYWMALRTQCDVMYLALVDNIENILSVTRHMVTMNALTASSSLIVHSTIAETNLWLKTLREVYRPGDRIVCHEEQSVKNGFLRTEPVRDFLGPLFDGPVITLSGFYHPQQLQIRQWVDSIVIWLGFISILAVFTILETQLDQVLQGFAGKLLLIFLLLLEFGAILAWDAVRGQDKK